MKIFEANITCKVVEFLKESLKNIVLTGAANQMLYNQFGILHSFENDDELSHLKEQLSIKSDAASEPDRVGYGDFQTNADLSDKVAVHLITQKISPDIIIEPTCGKGAFILASLKRFTQLKAVYGIEIYKPYVWECKFGIMDFFLDNPQANKPDIVIFHSNVFDFNFNQIREKHAAQNILIIGNLPWVTNSKLGCLDSENLPKKTNSKNYKGLDAITGKGNFDIAEYITTSLIDTFQETQMTVALLVKNTVIKNIVFDQSKSKRKISEIRKYCINSKKEFNVSVEASLFYCKMQSSPEFDCIEFDFYSKTQPIKKLGWTGQKFVSNIDAYLYTKNIDGESPFVWRQGLKHDCSAVMELERVKGHYTNGLNEEFVLESDLVYGMLKSSDLKNTVINQPRKFTLVTQKNIGQETNCIKRIYPDTYRYLFTHKAYFDARKSIIYNNRPSFSIFGIGDYSFAPYKTAISGLYKTFHFTLVLPFEEKPVMLDDTCYFIGFDKIEFAVYSLLLLNSKECMLFLKSVTFPDAKRTFTKDILMRIDLFELAKSYSEQERQNDLIKLNETYGLHLTLELWDSFIAKMRPAKSSQPTLEFG
ncbi:type II restriction m6 adenine DNA methyltransferase, Alw26I/Eco31I/Esp3I family [Bacteroidales bacterium Barb4]|nr:type II restriction m6 adenine DNA methyltransferase, Alw26I/Eco31I/Esp3I family [Bacteroidales bacterium Barb4]